MACFNEAEIKAALYNTLPGEKAHYMMAPQPKIIKEYEGNHAGPPVESAVLVLVIQAGSEPVIPFIKRSNSGKYHNGQIALPGGKAEQHDLDVFHTALRESYEEIGIPAEQVSVWGTLSSLYIPLSNFNITPVIGSLSEMPEFIISKEEVEQIILIKVSDLLEEKNKTRFSFHRHGQEIIAPGYQVEENFIWGATAMIISEFEQLIKSVSGVLHL